MFPLCGKKFQLVRVGLMRAGCPVELANLEGNIQPVHIVIVKNTAKLGTISATGFYPRAVIVAGALTRQRLMEGGVPRTWAYVEAGALDSSDNEVMTCGDLLRGLERSITLACGAAAIRGQVPPLIDRVYPFRDYCEYVFNGHRFRQPYAITAAKEVLVAGGRSVMVQGKFVQADGVGSPFQDSGMHTGNAKESMQRVQTGVRYAYAPPRAQLQSFSTGGATSELVTQIYRNWSNITAAANMYLAYMKGRDNKKPMRPAFCPVGLTDDGKITSLLTAKGIDAYDFAIWSADEQQKKTKKVAGEDLPHTAFAYVGDKDDPSTWKLPVKFKSPGKSAAHAKNALGRINQTKAVPGSAKPGVLQKVRKAAKTHGVEVSTKPTEKQHNWAAAGV